MRRVVWVVVVLVVVGGGAAAADTVARGQAEDRIAAEATAIPGVTTTPDVSIGGFPFLTQVAGGSLDTVRLGADTATIDGLVMDHLVLELSDVLTQAPYTAARAVLTARTTPDAVQDVLPVDLDLAVHGGKLVAVTEVLGLPLDVVLVPRADGRDVLVDVTEFVLAGVSVSADELPADLTASLQGLRFSISDLPAGMSLTDVSVLDDGLVLRAEGTDFDLGTVAAAG